MPKIEMSRQKKKKQVSARHQQDGRDTVFRMK